MATAGIATANAFGNVGVHALRTTGHIILAPVHIIMIIIGSIVAIIIIIIIIAAVAASTSSSSFSNFILKPMNILKNTFSHTNTYTNNKCNKCNNSNKCTLSNQNNTITSLSDKQSNSMMGLALHRSRNNLQKQQQSKSLLSANKAAKLNFGQNTYNELTSYE